MHFLPKHRHARLHDSWPEWHTCLFQKLWYCWDLKSHLSKTKHVCPDFKWFLTKWRVVYFDQLLGAACTKKLLELLFRRFLLISAVKSLKRVLKEQKRCNKVQSSTTKQHQLRTAAICPDFKWLGFQIFHSISTICQSAYCKYAVVFKFQSGKDSLPCRDLKPRLLWYQSNVLLIKLSWLDNPTSFDHLESRLVLISDPHCI